MMSIFSGFLLAFVSGLVLLPFARKLAVRSGFLDKPDDRKQHAKPVPPVGGLVIFPVFIIVSLIMGADIRYFWPLYAGIIVLLIAGSFDDRAELSAWPKFIIQLGVASAVVLSGQARLYVLGDMFGFGTLGLGFMSIPFSIAAVMLLINAINLIDGLDGLAGGFSAIVLFWLIFACAMAGVWPAIEAIAPLLGALLAFLGHNIRSPFRRKASIFLGDAGSMALGLSLAWFCIGLAQPGVDVLPPIAIAWILALPIIDTCAQFYRRVREGRHPFSPDRGHFHHHFIHAGIPTGESVSFILSVAFLLGAIGYLGIAVGIPQVILTVAWIALLFTHMRLSEKPDVYINLFNKLAR